MIHNFGYHGHKSQIHSLRISWIFPSQIISMHFFPPNNIFWAHKVEHNHLTTRQGQIPTKLSNPKQLWSLWKAKASNSPKHVISRRFVEGPSILVKTFSPFCHCFEKGNRSRPYYKWDQEGCRRHSPSYNWHQEGSRSGSCFIWDQRGNRRARKSKYNA